MVTARRALKRSVIVVLIFVLRGCQRFRFFPFTLGYVLLSSAIKVIELWRRGYRLARVGEVDGAAVISPVGVMLWLDELRRELRAVDAANPEPRARQFDVCLRLSPDAADANLHDVFSVLLVSPSVRSMGFYWDESSLRDDLPWWRRAGDRRSATNPPTTHHDLRRPGVEACRAFFEAHQQGIVLPVAANRDVRTLVKRLAGAAYAVCLNVPEEVRWLVDDTAMAFADVKFFDIDPTPPGGPAAARNVLSLYGYGLNLHERMAVAQATDAYIGRFDEAGCAALGAGCPTVLIGDGAATDTEPLSRVDTALWLPDPSSPDIRAAVLAFLRRHTVGAGSG